MRFRERRNEHSDVPGGPGDENDPGGEDLSDARNAGDELLSAGDDAINKALSHNSAAFLKAGKQQSGQ